MRNFMEANLKSMKFRMIAIPDRFSEKYGGQEMLLDEYGLSSLNIENQFKDLLKLDHLNASISYFARRIIFVLLPRGVKNVSMENWID